MVAVLAAVASAEAKPVARELGDGAMVDWSRGALLAPGAAPGDLRAPTPAMARTKAQRLARQRAQARLAAAALQLPVFGGGTLGERLASGRAGLDAAIAQATIASESLGSDGSSVVSLAVGLEAMRALLVAGPEAATQTKAAKSDASVAVDSIVIDARGVELAPALGVTVVAEQARYIGPVLFFASRSEALADARVGTHRDAKARAVAADGVRIEGLSGDQLGALAEGRPLVVFVISTGGRAKGKKR